MKRFKTLRMTQKEFFNVLAHGLKIIGEAQNAKVDFTLYHKHPTDDSQDLFTITYEELGLNK